MSNERKHAELIKRWAENKDLAVEYKSSKGDFWSYVENPIWSEDTEYRFGEDPYKHLKEALQEGKIIQIADYRGNWRDLNSSPSFNQSAECYRIKPEPEYIPFTWEDRELLRGKWVRYISDDIKFEGIIDSIQDQGVTISNKLYAYSAFLQVYKFIDGTPCGKLVHDESN